MRALPGTGLAARPARLVVLAGGDLVLYVERGGKTAAVVD